MVNMRGEIDPDTDEETLWEFVRRLEERIEALEQDQQWLHREIGWLKKDK